MDKKEAIKELKFERNISAGVMEQLGTTKALREIVAIQQKKRTQTYDAGNRGIPLQEIQMYAGHQKPDTTMMYVTVSEENVRASFRRYIA